jgi:pyruvate kinase
MPNKPLLKTKTKIVATLGPNSSTAPVIEKMLNNGLNVARINMSHGDHETHAAVIATARKASKKSKIPLAILQDLAGPKIRIGDFETDEVTLIPGNKLTLSTAKFVGTVDRVSINYPKLPSEVASGMSIFLNDGKQELRVESTTDTEVITTVVVGGTIKGRRGLNIPDGELTISSITAKDKKDLVFGIGQDVDFMTLSFVRSADDVHQLRKLILKEDKESKISIVAKIETKQAIDNLEEIIEAADAIMVARGDLAVEVPLEKVPMLQKRIIRIANRAGKPVITATQMLDSMKISTTPTRAEVTDIASAILDGTHALMLSDETAVGAHPEKPIAIMRRVAREIEKDEFYLDKHKEWDFPPETVCDAVSRSIVFSRQSSNAKALVALSESGHTARMIARYRPQVPMLVLTPHYKTFQQMLLVYGCEPVLIKLVKNLVGATKLARKYILEKGLAEPGDKFILGAGIPFGKSGMTNTMVIEEV